MNRFLLPALAVVLTLALAGRTQAQDALALGAFFASADALPPAAAVSDDATPVSEPAAPDSLLGLADGTLVADDLLTRPVGLAGAGLSTVPALAALAPDGPGGLDLAALHLAERLPPAALDTLDSPVDTLRMSMWERVWWGRGGVFRRTGLFPLHPENPTDDLRQIASVRRRMLGLHQTLGLVTVASMATTVIAGQVAVSTGNSGVHKASLPVTIGLYTATAGLSLLSPPKLVSFEGGGIDSITIHRWLAVGHVAGMILTPLLAPDDGSGATAHQISGYATFGTFAAAMLVVTFLRR